MCPTSVIVIVQDSLGSIWVSNDFFTSSVASTGILFAREETHSRLRFSSLNPRVVECDDTRGETEGLICLLGSSVHRGYSLAF